jgi:hypothetical protein
LRSTLLLQTFIIPFSGQFRKSKPLDHGNLR